MSFVDHHCPSHAVSATCARCRYCRICGRTEAYCARSMLRCCDVCEGHGEGRV